MRKLTKSRTMIPAFLLLALSAALPAAGDGDQVELDYTRARVERRPGVRPEKPLPRELRISVDATRREPEARHRPQGPRSDAPGEGEPDWQRLAQEARRAASALASDKVDREGRRYLWTAGYYDGLHDALDDPRLGRWDHQDGFERGLRARDAHRLGNDLGYGEAEREATDAALSDVAAQFHDLSREPRFTSRTSVPAFDVATGYARPPRLRDVFRGLSCHRDTPFGALHAHPWELYRHTGYGDFYDRRWWKPAHAFGTWQRRHGSFWGNLAAEEKEYFRDVFLHRYERELARFHAQVTERAYHRGFEHGHDHGAEIQYEWSYRQGFHEGWSEAFRASARDAFHHGYRETYAERYGASFDDWSTSPRPEIGALFLSDADADGVFEPGEGIRLDYEITNYGGAAGAFRATLSGAPLAAPATAEVALPRRQTVRSSWPLEAVIDARQRPRTQGELDFRLAGPGGGERRLSPSGDQRGETLPLYVSYPLELDRRVALLAHDTLAGRAVIEVRVRNTSRRPVAGSLALQSPFLGAPLGRQLDALPAGGERRVAFELVGLKPLDLLGGTVEVDLVASSRGKLHDELSHRLPALALDLGKRDLLELMAALAASPAASPAEIRRAQELMLRRLRLDWDAVASADGNAYKQDLKTGGRSTALGDLVATYRDGRRGFRHREVFTGLAPHIEALAKELPGSHPFLRRSMRKLARQLG